MALLERLSDLFDQAWEEMIYDPCSDLSSLMDVDEIDARWITYLKPLLGFTDDISLPASIAELRRILHQAPAFWAAKPTEQAVVQYAIRMVTGNRFRAANFFDFRMQTDKTVITEELEDFDPYAISFPTAKWTGTSGVLGEAGPTFFNLNDAPDVFSSNSGWGWILVTDPTHPSNNGIYQVSSTVAGTRFGYVVGGWAVSHANPVTWTLIGWAGEYLTEVRVVDPGVGDLKYKDLVTAFTAGERVVGQVSGAYGTVDAIDLIEGELSLKKITGRFQDNEQVLGSLGGDATAFGELSGVLNRHLLRILADLARPFGERIDIVYINFLDQFLAQGDLHQWTVTGDAGVPEPGGDCVIGNGSRIDVSDPTSPDWGGQCTAFKFSVNATDAQAEFRFFNQDVSNHYFVVVDYAVKTVELWKRVGGTPTQIGSTVGLPILKAGVAEVLRIDALAEGAGTRIRVKLAGDVRIDALDAAGAFSEGGVSIEATSKDLRVHLVEVNVLPAEIDRVGPNP